jgi:fluoride exporter
MQAYLLVMTGGALGAGARFALGNAVAARWGTVFPWSTLTVNIIGCLAMGMLAAWLARSGTGETIRLLLGIGLLGGFTTFSAFSLDWWTLMERGAVGAAMGYAAASLVAGLAAFWAGHSLMRWAA